MPEGRIRRTSAAAEPTGAKLRPCAGSARAALMADSSALSILRPFLPLFRPLPLLGAIEAMDLCDGRSRLGAALVEVAPWAASVADAIDAQLALRSLSHATWMGWRPLCLVGPSGSGKSWIARQLAARSGTSSVVLDVAGGQLRPFEGSLRPIRAPGLAARAMAATRTANPVVLLDGIERIAARADRLLQADALRAMMTRGINNSFFDVGLQQELDVSEINWLLTCADESWLPAEISSRAQIVRIVAPRQVDLPAVVRSMTASVAAEAGIEALLLPPITGQALETLTLAYARRPSLWSLRRGVEAVMAAMLRDEAAHAH